MRIVKPSYEIKTEIENEKILNHLEMCARNCYKSEVLIKKGSSEKFLKNIIKSGHDSILEHYSVTVKFVTSRAVLAQLTRHRLSSFAVESQRYCNYNKEKFDGQVTFVQPTWINKDFSGEYNITWAGIYGIDMEVSNNMDKPTNRWFWNCAVCERDYLRLINEGWIPERAREVLNNSAKTEIIMTANLREWRTIFKQRCKSDAQSEIRSLLTDLLNEFKEKMPVLFEDLEFEDKDNG